MKSEKPAEPFFSQALEYVRNKAVDESRAIRGLPPLHATAPKKTKNPITSEVASPGQGVNNDKAYTVDVFTERSVNHGFPENSYDADSLEDVIRILRNVADPISGIRRVNVWINREPANEILSVEQRKAASDQEEQRRRQYIDHLKGIPHPFPFGFETSYVNTPAFMNIKEKR